MRYKILCALLIATIAFGGHLLWSVSTATPVAAQASIESLSPYMNHFQRYMHKMALAIDATNQPLAAFYASKVRETLGDVGKKVPTYQSLQIAALGKAMLEPPLTPLDGALKGTDWAAINKAYDGVVTGCNNCHIATQRPFIKVTRGKANPYNQDFSK